MAGAGYKLFNTGDVLLASEVNTYLQEQVIMVFANAAARTTALSGVLAEGMASYLKDTDSFEVYNGSAWVSASGDLTALTAGTGISISSSTGPVPTVTNSMATEITAAGDMIVGTGSGTFDNLPIGTTGQVLTADTSVSPYKVKWAAAAGGKVLQVVQGTITSQKSTSSTSFIDSDLTVSITPSSSSNKVLVMASFYGAPKGGASQTNLYALYQLVRSSTVLQDQAIGEVNQASASNNEHFGRVSFAYLDSPATTSSTTYKIQYRAVSPNQAFIEAGAANIASIIVQEIGA